MFRRLSRWKHAYKLLQSAGPVYVRHRSGGEHGVRSDQDADRGTSRGGKPPLMQKSPFLCWRRGTRSVARSPPRFLQAAFIISNPRPGRPDVMSGRTGGMVKPPAGCKAAPEKQLFNYLFSFSKRRSVMSARCAVTLFALMFDKTAKNGTI